MIRTEGLEVIEFLELSPCFGVSGVLWTTITAGTCTSLGAVLASKLLSEIRKFWPIDQCRKEAKWVNTISCAITMNCKNRRP